MRAVLTGLAKRRLGEVVEARLAEEPVVVLNGPRTVGKSTLLSQLAGHLGRAVIDCDDLATRAAVRDDPARFVESDQPVLIDEYQHVGANSCRAVESPDRDDDRQQARISGRSSALHAAMGPGSRRAVKEAVPLGWRSSRMFPAGRSRLEHGQVAGRGASSLRHSRWATAC